MPVDKLNSINSTNEIKYKSKIKQKNHIYNSPIKNDVFELSNKNEVKKEPFVDRFLKKIINKWVNFLGNVQFPKNKRNDNIVFKEAKTVDEAVKFGKENLNIKKYKGFEDKDLDVLNWINEGLVNVNNYSKGSAVMPKTIIFDDLDELKAAQVDNLGRLTINKDFTNKLKNKFNLPYKDIREFLGNCQKLFSKKFNMSYISTFSDIYHEAGHLQNNANLGFVYNLIILKIYQNKEIPSIYENEVNEKINLFNGSKKIAAKVSAYAKTSPCEFVAECFAQSVDGVKLDDDVIDLYKKLGGVIF